MTETKTKTKTLYPMVMSMKVAITNEDGSNTGSATYLFPASEAPTSQDVAKAFDEVKASLPDGLRLMTRNEFFIEMIRHKTGQRMNFALPKQRQGEEWHDPETAETPCMWFLDEEGEEE